MPVKNDGVLGELRVANWMEIKVKDIDNKIVKTIRGINYFNSGATYDGITFLYSGGFMLSGYSNNFMWANGVTTASKIQDYENGPVGANINDPRNKIYILKRTDIPFGLS